MPFYRWSETAASNGSADPAINYLEGQAPSSINDSSRMLMAVLRMWGTDISGAIVTSGSATAYTVASHSVYDSLAHMDGQVVAFSPHTTNGGATTLNVDGLGAKPLRSAPSVEIAAGHLVQGTPYTCVYNSSDQAFYLHGFFGNPYGIPIGGLLPFTGTTAPNSSFVLPYGQAVSRSTYSTYFGMAGTSYGAGDGSTTFNVPDLRGRVAAGKDDMGGSASGRLTSATISSGSPTTLGGTGGLETMQLGTSNLPPYTPSGTIGTVTVNSTVADVGRSSTGSSTGGGGFGFSYPGAYQQITSTGSGPSFTGAAQGGTSAAFGRLQPTIILNYLLRVI